MAKSDQGTTVSASAGSGSTKVQASTVRLVMSQGGVGEFLDTIVGKRVVLRAVDDQGNLVPGRWKFDTTADFVKDYDCDWSGSAVASATVHFHTDADFTASEIALYWIEQGLGKHLSFTTDAAHGLLTLSMYVDVHAPTVLLGSATTTRVLLAQSTIYNSPNSDPPRKANFLNFGDRDKKRAGEWPGIRFNYVVMPPTGGDGQIAGVQLFWSRTVITEVGLQSPIVHKPVWKETEDYWLDSGAPYAAACAVTAGIPAVWGGESWDNGDGDGPHNTRFDNPGRFLQYSWLECRIDERFCMYLMYRPAGSGKESIWVTLRCIDWWWTARVTSASGNDEWEEAETPGWSPNPDGRVTSQLPTWTRTYVGADTAGANTGLYWNPPLS